MNNTNPTEQQKAKIAFALSLLLLSCSICLYFTTGIFGYNFPTQQVLLAIIPTIINVSICYILGGIQPNMGQYTDPFGVIGGIIFNMTIFTGAFLMFGKL